MPDPLGTAELPDVGPEDHVRGRGVTMIVLSDFECPYCAQLHVLLKDLPVRQVFRHFPVKSSHPRAWAAACAAEAAGLQGQFWGMHDLLFEDQARLEDPHLWECARTLGLDVERFESDRRSQAVADRVQRDFHGAIRAGVMTTPTVSAAGQRLCGRISQVALERLLEETHHE